MYSHVKVKGIKIFKLCIRYYCTVLKKYNNKGGVSFKKPGNKVITVHCEAGLGNRMRVLMSALFLSEYLKMEMHFTWNKRKQGGAHFNDLFDNPDIAKNIISSHKLFNYKIYRLDMGRGEDRKVFDILTLDFSKPIAIQSYDWLLKPWHYKYHEPMKMEAKKLFDRFRPIEYIEKEVEKFKKDNFDSTILGVHIRRGDFTFVHEDNVKNIESFIDYMKDFLFRYPDGKFFVSTDDGAPTPYGVETQRENVLDKIITVFGGDKVLFYTPRSLKRDEKEAIQDALINIYLLRATHEFVGSKMSSFSELAMINRPIKSSKI